MMDSLEQKLKHYEQSIFGMQEYIETKLRETDFQSTSHLLCLCLVDGAYIVSWIRPCVCLVDGIEDVWNPPCCQSSLFSFSLVADGMHARFPPACDL